MSSIPRARLAETISSLDTVLARYTAMSVNLTGVSYGGFDAMNIVSSLAIAPTPPLLALHREVCDALAGLRTAPTKPEQFADAAAVEENSRRYVEQFLAEHAYERFDPHITVGFGRLQRQPTVGSFIADRVAICQLGPYCTCRKVLYQADLAPAS